MHFVIAKFSLKKLDFPILSNFGHRFKSGAFAWLFCSRFYKITQPNNRLLWVNVRKISTKTCNLISSVNVDKIGRKVNFYTYWEFPDTKIVIGEKIIFYKSMK